MTMKERTLQETPTWAIAVVCFVLLFISIGIERIIRAVGHWLEIKHKRALYQALEKVKGELMLLGFISLLLTVFQDLISGICISQDVASTWHPCRHGKNSTEDKTGNKESGDNHRRLLEFSDSGPSLRRILATKGYDKCADKNKVAFVSAYGIHQLHIFIFVLAIFHVLGCLLVLALGRIKMRKWKTWEEETKSIEYQVHNDAERFRLTRETTFGRRHLHRWSQSSIYLWIVSFFRQFYGPVTKVDYLALRRGFIIAHLTLGSESKFDFHKYINRSLEEDFKVVVEISPMIWFFAVLFLLANTQGWYSYYWFPFIPLIITLLVGAKLQMVITQMGLRIQERGEVVRGAPLVEPRDDLFWFNCPHILLYLIHFVFFENAFQLAFFAWSEFDKLSNDSCFYSETADVVIRISMGVVIQILCSYVTLPLYALVTQMGSTMRPTIFNERVVAALKNWHHTARKRVKDKHSKSNIPFSSRLTTPAYGMSPVHFLHKHTGRSDHAPTPMTSNYEYEHWDAEGSTPPSHLVGGNKTQMQVLSSSPTTAAVAVSTDLPPGPGPLQTQHEINISVSDFSFKKPQNSRE